MKNSFNDGLFTKTKELEGKYTEYIYYVENIDQDT